MHLYISLWSCCKPIKSDLYLRHQTPGSRTGVHDNIYEIECSYETIRLFLTLGSNSVRWVLQPKTSTINVFDILKLSPDQDLNYISGQLLSSCPHCSQGRLHVYEPLCLSLWLLMYHTPTCLTAV